MDKLITNLKLLSYPTTINDASIQWQITQQHARNRLAQALEPGFLVRIRHRRVWHYTITTLGILQMLKD